MMTSGRRADDPDHASRPRLDAIDLRILAVLQREGRITKLALAERVGLSPSPCWERLRRLEDAGAHGTVSYPFLYALGPTSTLDAKRRYLEGYAENVIRKLR